MCGDQCALAHSASCLTQFAEECWGLVQKSQSWKSICYFSSSPLSCHVILDQPEKRFCLGSPRIPSVLVQSSVDWVVYNQQKFPPHGFGGWMTKIRAPVQLASDEGPLPGCRQYTAFSLCPHMAEGAMELPGVSLARELISFKRAPPS